MMIIYLVLMFFIIEITSYLILKKARLIIKEFPKVEINQLSKYLSFDNELGWEPTPNSTKKDFGITRSSPKSQKSNHATYSIDKLGSRKINEIMNKVPIIST